jgi:heme/copper-type cytochrome/quinol oxidase subunit 3
VITNIIISSIFFLTLVLHLLHLFIGSNFFFKLLQKMKQNISTKKREEENKTPNPTFSIFLFAF